MNQMNAVEKFEHEVRTVVRRGSKSIEFESPIKEVSTHFADLIQEELENGVSTQEATELAKKRLGSPLTVGMQILNSPSRISRGIRMQKFALIALSFLAIHFVALTYFGLKGMQGTALTVFGYSFFGIFLAAAISFGLGTVLSKRVVWKPLLAIIPASIVLFGLTEMALMPLFVTYLDQPGMQAYKKTFEPLTLLSALDYGFQVSLRLIGFFVVIALITFMTGRIWLTRLSWFRLTLR
jgi:hypothetical protein